MNVPRLFERGVDRPWPELPEASAVVRLDSQQVWTHRIMRGGELRVTCLRGQVWITREGDARDHFLLVDDTYASVEPGLVCVQALASSRLVVTRNCFPMALSVAD